MLSPIHSLHSVSQITTIKIIKFCLKHFSRSPMMSSKTRLALNNKENLNVWKLLHAALIPNNLVCFFMSGGGIIF